MIFAFLILWIILLYIFKNKAKHRNYVGFVTIALILISGLRSWKVGVDTRSYVEAFRLAPTLSSATISKIFLEREALYYFFQSFIKTITNNYTVFLMIIAIFFCCVIAKLVYTYSKNPMLSYLMFLSMGYFYFSMAGLRQTIAMGFLILAFMAICEKKYVKGLLFILIASGFHISSLAFLIVYLLLLLPLNFWYVLIISVLSIVAAVQGPQIVRALVDLIWGDTRSYDVNEFGGISTLVLLILISICLIFVNRRAFRTKINLKTSRKSIQTVFAKKTKEDIFNQLSVKTILFSIPIQVLAIYQANAFRLSMLFHVFTMIVVPNTIREIKDKKIVLIANIVLGFLLCLQFFLFTYDTAGINPYTFFWEL